MKAYLDHHKRIVVLTDLRIMYGFVLIVDVYSFQPLSRVKEVIFGDVKRQAVDRRNVEHIRNGLVVLSILLIDLPDGGCKMRHINLSPVPFYPFRLIMEVIAAVSLHLRDEHRDVVCLKLIRRE